MSRLDDVCHRIGQLRSQLAGAYVERAALMAEAHTAGLSLRRIGDRVGLSHVAVRKAIDEHYGADEIARMLRLIEQDGSRPPDRGGRATVRRP